MAVMQNLREYTKVILVILVLAFVGTIVFDWGMNLLGMKTTRNVVGKVNGAEITVTQYEQAYANQRENFRNRTGNEPNDSQADFLRNQAWEALVQEHLIQQTLAKKNIAAHDKEIVHLLFNDPPEFLKSQEVFQNEQKQFDMAKYQAALYAPGSSAQWKYVEDILRQSLPYDKFQERLRASVRVTDEEVKMDYIVRNQKVNVKYIFFDPNKLLSKEIEITEEMRQQYYKQHQEDFKEEEKRKIDYVIFSTNATAEDSSAQWELARSLLERAQNGEDFSELAEIYSQDPGTKDKGGDLGYFETGAMLKPFEEAAFGAKVGEIVGPVVTNYGLHLIKVDDKKREDNKDKVKARHILIKLEASRKTYSTARDDALYFAEEAKNAGFEELAKEMNLEIKSTDFFIKGNGFVPVLGLNKGASNFIFRNEKDKVGSAEEMNQGFFVYTISEIQKEREQPLSEVTQVIDNKIKQEKRLQMSGDLALKLYNDIQGGIAFETAAVQDSLEIKEVSFARSGYVTGIGREPNFIGAAFALSDPNDVSKPIEATRGYYLIKLLGKDAINEEDFNAQKESLGQQLLRRKQGQTFANWLANVKERSKIEDYRDQLYN
ncbi:MAG: peptidylprolyl isomerase [bacterium]